jgi:5'-nucleotidase
MTPHGRRGRKTKLAALGIAALTSAAMFTTSTSAAAPAGAKEKPRHVKLQILALNDFHGQLEPVATGSSSHINDIKAGGAEFLATHLKQLRKHAKADGAKSITVAAGDLIGATPLLSAAFHDEPTIEAMNEMGLEISSVGNHEFDEGWRELVRMQEGGCLDDGPDGANNQNSCPDGEEFEGADFQYLSANVFHEDSGETVFPGVKIKRVGGVPVGFIGMTLENTPNIVTKAGVEGLKFTDEVETANKAAAALKEKGVESVVALLHEGGFPTDRRAYNSCPGISGPIVGINDGLSPEIDVVITGHTHQGYNCALEDPAGDQRLVTSSASLGRLVTDIDLTIDRRSGEIDRESAIANNLIVTRDVRKAKPLTELIAKYKELVAPIESKVIGQLAPDTTSVSRTADDSGESSLGNLIADAQKADQSLLAGGPAPEIAFMNPGGIRNDLVADDAGEVTYGAAFSTQPFNNYDVAMDLTGSQILALLEQQWSGANSVAEPKILQVSGIEYAYSASAPSGSRVIRDSVAVNGAPLDEARTYRVTANSFLSDGGDGFGVFAQATNKFFGGLDIDALAAYLSAHNPYTPAATDRIDVRP